MWKIVCTGAIGLLLLTEPLAAQAPPAAPPPPTTPPPPAAEDEGLTVRGSSVGYIDTAAVGNQLFFRSDFGYGFPFPNRAEFFYPRNQPTGRGLPLAERSIDFQDLMVHVEGALGQRVSAFVEAGSRFLNPEVNANAAGWSDTVIGLKYALLATPDKLATFQLRTYVPTGSANRGLGTGHVSLEPGLLGFANLTNRLGLAGEFRCWVPIDGSAFAGTVLRYGLGTRSTLWESGNRRVSPTLEVIGWTVLAGQESQLGVDDTVLQQAAAGVTVVNLKVGARIDLSDRFGLYAGYGRAITGQQWYKDVLRLEARWLY
ncbi:hypothetical protein [Limnoglobus roseus]|uniref:Transporter n=1 Tax=Limnoglobus roseus TaxID=2598579 RepID=A0A5C1AB87_9BACT|nr:hypothetical protein [Limnoglobus roseus]QEL16501.1 hypothetical protein PX52LOC_03460 [Limnoglobus roseus]